MIAEINILIEMWGGKTNPLWNTRIHTHTHLHTVRTSENAFKRFSIWATWVA